MPQQVTITASADADDDADRLIVIHEASGGGYDGIIADLTVTVTEDADDRGVTISRARLDLEEGDEDTYTVVLDSEPTGSVSVRVKAPAGTGVTVDKPALTFTDSNWDTEQTVTVRSEEDSDVEDETATLAHQVLGGGYGGVKADDVSVSVRDDDTPGVTVHPTMVPVDEGDDATYTVALDTRPAADVTVTINDPTDNTDVTVNQPSLTFTPDNWDREQTARVTAAHDDDLEAEDEIATVTHTATSTDTDYDGIAISDVTVNITDDDPPPDRLMPLVADPKDIDGFDPEIFDYMVGVAASVTQSTITPTAFRSDDAITIDGTTVASGSAHTVELSAGLNTFEVVVSSVGSSDPTTYTVYIGRGTTGHGGWKAGDDLDTLRGAGNTSPTGVWSNGAALWIADSTDGMLYAYTLAGGARDSSKDIALDADNASPAGIWSDNTTIRVADQLEGKVYAYTLADGARDSSRDIALSSDNGFPWGIWSNDTTIWVVDVTDDKLYAYTLADGARDSDRDIDLSGDNTSPRGIWSDETTIWVADSGDDKLYAYTLADGDRAAGHDIGLHSSNADAAGVWGNGDTAWVANSIAESGSPFDRVYTYNNIPVTVSFEQSAYTVAEGGDVTVKVTLSADPKRKVVVPITADNQDGASNGDYSGVPADVTFNSGETEKSSPSPPPTTRWTTTARA